MLGFVTFQFLEIIGRLNDTVADTTKIVSNMESIIKISLKINIVNERISNKSFNNINFAKRKLF